MYLQGISRRRLPTDYIRTLLKRMDDDGIRFVYKANDVTLFPFLRQLKCCYTEAEINVQRI